MKWMKRLKTTREIIFYKDKKYCLDMENSHQKCSPGKNDNDRIQERFMLIPLYSSITLKSKEIFCTTQQHLKRITCKYYVNKNN